LLLQDQQGADVNLLFCSGWAASNYRRLDIPYLSSQVLSLRLQYIAPLRTLRRELSNSDATQSRLRQLVLALELKAEQVEIAILFKLLDHSLCQTPIRRTPTDLKDTDTGFMRHSNLAICYLNLLDTLAIQSQPQGQVINELKELSSLLLNKPGQDSEPNSPSSTG